MVWKVGKKFDIKTRPEGLWLKDFVFVLKEPEEVESENVLSDLVNYIQPVHFKGFEVSECEYNF